MQFMEVMEILNKTGAYKQGHFKLSSGLHSPAYLQCALVLQDPVIAARVSGALAEKVRELKPDIVVGPAMGGIIFAYEMARHLNARSIFTERDPAGEMKLRRGFKIFPGSRVMIAEDVLTTGKSIKEVISLLKEKEITPVGIVCLVDRSETAGDFNGIKFKSLIKLEIPVFPEAKCPLCQEGIPIEKPGSRK